MSVNITRVDALQLSIQIHVAARGDNVWTVAGIEGAMHNILSDAHSRQVLHGYSCIRASNFDLIVLYY
jgi:hypothetical protein